MITSNPTVTDEANTASIEVPSEFPSSFIFLRFIPDYEKSIGITLTIPTSKSTLTITLYPNVDG
jgi:hypothetical protein